jgi:hypothetical protein
VCLGVFFGENMVTANVFSVYVLSDVEVVVRVGERQRAETLALSVPDIACLDHRRIFGGGLESAAKADLATKACRTVYLLARGYPKTFH